VATAKKPSLSEFATLKAPPPCRVCVMPEREEIDANYNAGVPRRVILEWLWEVKEYKTIGNDGVSASALDKHLTNKHHVYKD